MAIPAFIAANPGLSLSVVSLLGKLGSGILGRNDAKDAMNKAEEENRKIMAQANLRQSFGGNPSVDLVQPKLDPGLGTTLLGKLGDAAGLASQAYGLYDAKKLRDLQKLNVQGQMDSRTLTDDITRGATMGAGSILPKTDTIKVDPGALSKLPAGPTGTARLGADPIIELGGSVAPPELSSVGQAAFSAAQNERIASRATAQSAAQQQAFENNKVLSDLFLKEQDLSLRTQIFNDKTKNLGKLSQKDRMAAEKTLRTDFNKLTGDFRSVGDSFNTIMAGAENPTGVSDDPRSTVRESEFAQAEQAGALPDRVQNVIGRFWDGQRLTTNRGAFLTQAKNLYDARMPAYTNISDNYTAIAGRESLDARNVVMDYTVNLDRFDEILKKSQPQLTTGSGETHGQILNFLKTYKPGRVAPGAGVLRREYQR
mgnify:CR=1 FL=1